MCFFGYKVFLGEALAGNSFFSGDEYNNHVIYEYRFDGDNLEYEGKFILIKKELRKAY